MSEPKKKAAKLYQVIKALTAMRLTKEDSVPNGILSRDGDGFTLTKNDNEKQACLFQGSIGAAFNQAQLEQAGITHILTAAGAIQPRFEATIKYKIIPLMDSPTCNIAKFFEEANEWIHEVLTENINNKVLVHCFAGKSRASTITLAYLMAKQRVVLKDAVIHLKARRPIAEPNVGFTIQLKAFEKAVFGECSDVPF